LLSVFLCTHIGPYTRQICSVKNLWLAYFMINPSVLYDLTC
jgi:hypothetical protein